MHRTRVLRLEFGPVIVLFPPRRGRSEHRQRRHRVPAEEPIDWSVTRLPTRKTWYLLQAPLPAIFPTGVCELLEAWRRAATAAWQLVGLRH